MGLTASSSNGSKPASVLPILGHGEYQNVGCADIMIASESENDLGLFARIFYPASARSDVVSFNSSFKKHTSFLSTMTLLCTQFGSHAKNILMGWQNTDKCLSISFISFLIGSLERDGELLLPICPTKDNITAVV